MAAGPDLSMRRRSLKELLSGGDRVWFDPAIDLLRVLGGSADPDLPRIIAPDEPVLIARAPGRLDVMGGIADYSGSLVLELPLARATHAILQPRRDGRVELASLRKSGVHHFSAGLEALTRGELATPESLSPHLRGAGEEWAAYVLGVVQFCARLATDRASSGGGGFSLVVRSDVPEGKGVSSSAALEVATMAVVAEHFELELEGAELAAACQWVENHVVGAPCGIMDQLTSTLGRRNRLLRLRCQPAIVEGYLEVPTEYRFYGIDSGVRHAVTGEDYVSVRAAAFMGYRILAEAAGLTAPPDADAARVNHPRWQGYLANVTPREWKDLEHRLPETLSGEEFLARHGGHADVVTRVRPDRRYRVRAATRHPILENARVERFAELLERLRQDPGATTEMGRLMYESHESYGACGLGSEGTDTLVEMVRRAGPDTGIFGAKITGGGSGGTVAVFARRDAEVAVRRIARRYGEATGVRAEVFADSGPGAEEVGILEGEVRRGA